MSPALLSVTALLVLAAWACWGFFAALTVLASVAVGAFLRGGPASAEAPRVDPLEAERKELDRKLREIAEKEHAYEALRATAALHRALFESSTWAIFTTDAQGIIQSFNETAEKWSGYSASQLVGRSTPALLHDGDEVAALARTLNQELGTQLAPGFEVLVRLAREAKADQREWTWVRRDSSRQPVLASFNPLRDLKGQVTGFLGIATDLTERNRVRAELTDAKENAERANQAKSEFLANMSHELRTPLNSIIGFANILLKNKDQHLNAKEITYLTRVADNGKHLLGLINTILDLSKIEAGRSEIVSEPVALPGLVREVVAQFEAQIHDRDLKLIAEVPDDIGPVVMDEQKMRQVLINLVGNALKFTEKGSVTVRIDVDPINLRPLAVEVIDTGVGIPQDRQSAVFEAFQQADNTTARVFGGTGLGLTITRALLAQMGFGIELSSEPGRGSTFRICLWDKPDAVLGREKVMSANQLRRQRASEKLVLIVDSDEASRLAMHRVVQEVGCRVVSAPLGAWGLELARLNHPDIVLMSLSMPDGGDVVRQMRAEQGLADTPVIAMTGAPTEDRGTLPGVEDYVRLPVDPVELSTALNRHLFPKRGKILVVDNDPFVTEVLTYALKEKGAEVRTAPNGQVALDVLRSYMPDLILLDMMMPVMTGMEFLEQYRKNPRFGSTAVYVLTGKVLPADQNEALTRMGVSVMIKGDSLDQLLTTVFQRLPERRSRDRSRKTVVRVAAKLAHLIPGFLRNRRDDVAAIRKALEAGDLATIEQLGNQLRGASGGYGFTDLTDIGHRLESAAHSGSSEELGRCLGALTQYLDSVEVIYQ